MRSVRPLDEATTSHPRLLFLGNLLSDRVGTTTVCEELIEFFGEEGWHPIAASPHKNRIGRIAHMASTAWLRRGSYDVAYLDVFSGKAFKLAEVCSALLRAARKPYIVNLHGGSLPDFAQQHPRRVRRLLRRAAFATAPSSYIAGHLRRFKDDIEIVPNSVVIGNYPFRERAQLQPSIVWVRAFHHAYAPTLALEVLKHVATNEKAARLVMVGPDKDDGSLSEVRQASRQVNLDDRVTIVGSVPKLDIPRWLDEGDIFLNTSRVDNFPVTVLEAMACGLCVVSTNVGGVPWLIQDGSNGLLVPPDDEHAMAHAVHRLLDDPQLASRLSTEARRTAERFDRPAIARRWQELFREASGARR